MGSEFQYAPEDKQEQLGFHYSVFGLFVRSNQRIPGLPLANSSASSPDLEVRLGVPPHFDGETVPDSEELAYVSSYTCESGEPALRVWQIAPRSLLRLAYHDGTQFWLDRKGNALWAVWSDSSSLENATSYLLGPILGLVLRLRGVICLHASAVAFEDRCVAFVGAEGTGKSTTAAAFARLGYAILSDDIVGLVEREGHFHVLPGYPHLSLWPDSVSMLYGSSDALPRFSEDWDKRRLALGDDRARFEGRCLPLAAIYILGPRRSEAAPCVEAVPTQRALLSLVANTYATNLIDREMRGQEFSVLSRLVSSVPVRLASPHEDATRIEELCTVIRGDFARLVPDVGANSRGETIVGV
jgi:hypothetical protein